MNINNKTPKDFLATLALIRAVELNPKLNNPIDFGGLTELIQSHAKLPGQFFLASDLTKIGLHLTTNQTVLLYLNGKIEELADFEEMMTDRNIGIPILQDNLKTLAVELAGTNWESTHKRLLTIARVIMDEYYDFTPRKFVLEHEPQNLEESLVLITQAFITQVPPRDIDRFMLLAECKFEATPKQVWSALMAGLLWLTGQN